MLQKDCRTHIMGSSHIDLVESCKGAVHGEDQVAAAQTSAEETPRTAAQDEETALVE